MHASPADCRASKPLQRFTWPVPAQRAIDREFGITIDYQKCGYHTGIDIENQQVVAIVAAAPGKVVHVGSMWYQGKGLGRGPYAVIIDHGGGVFTTYSHNSAALVKAGDCVRAGQSIAKMGNLGYVDEPTHHLHFEVLTNTTFTGKWAEPFSNVCAHYVDPLSFLQ